MTEHNQILIAHGDEEYAWVEGHCSLCGGVNPSFLSDYMRNGLISEVLVHIHRSGGPDGISFTSPLGEIHLPILHLFDSDPNDFDIISKFLDQPDGMILTRTVDEEGGMHIQWRWNEDGSD